MFVVNEDNSIYATRGDIVFFKVTAEDDGKAYTFKAGDVVRIKVYGKKNANNVVLQKDFPVIENTAEVEIFLTEEDTKFGGIISKPTDYWYEVELNPDDNPQTIIGYNEDGAVLFRLFPEGADIDRDEHIPTEEDIPFVDEHLDLASPRPVANSAIAKELAEMSAKCDATFEAVAENFVTPQMFGAVGDGVADDTKAIQDCINENDIIFFDNKTYIVSGIEIPANKTVHFVNTTIKKIDQSVAPAVKITGSNVSVLGTPTVIGTRFDDETEFCHCVSVVNNAEPIGNIYIESLHAENAQGDGLYIGSSTHNLHDIKVGRVFSKNCFRHGLAITSGQNVTIDSIMCEGCSVDFEPYGENVVLRNIVTHKVVAASLHVVPQTNLAYNIQFGNVILADAPETALVIHSCNDIKFDKLTIESSGTHAILFDIHHAVMTELCEINSLCIKGAYTTYADGVQNASYIAPHGVERLVVNHADVHGDTGRTIDLFLGNGNDRAEIVVNGGNITAYRVGKYIIAKLSNCKLECVVCLMGAFDNSFVRDCEIECQTVFSYAQIKALAHDNIITATSLQSNATWTMHNNFVNGTFTA